MMLHRPQNRGERCFARVTVMDGWRVCVRPGQFGAVPVAGSAGLSAACLKSKDSLWTSCPAWELMIAAPGRP